MENAGTVGMLLALAIGTVKLLEKVVEWGITKIKEKRSKKGSNGHSNGNGHSHSLDAKTIQALKEMHDIVQLRDSDGVPMVYWPRSQVDIQKEIVSTLHDINRSQDRMVDRLDQIADNTRK